MKICLISDIHFGVRKNSEIFLTSQLRFIEEQFVPYLKEKGIKDIFILGDLFDNRNSTNTKVMNSVYDMFDKQLGDFNIRMIVGNHDCYFNSSVEINSLKFLEKFKNVQLIEKITETTVDGRKIVMVPWITDNLSFIRDFSQIQDCDLCFGHFNINGFSFNKFKESDDRCRDWQHHSWKGCIENETLSSCYRFNSSCEAITYQIKEKEARCQMAISRDATRATNNYN
jgi:predicted phosphodiesterase